MWPLIIFLLLALLVLIAIEFRERQRKKSTNKTDSITPSVNKRSEVCCGEHLVCEKEIILHNPQEILYYDDEELDSLADIEPENFTVKQTESIEQVFRTLQEKDIAGWCRSLQQRNINLPNHIKEEALLILKEQREQ